MIRKLYAEKIARPTHIALLSHTLIYTYQLAQYYMVLTFFIKNGDDNQEIACEAERGGDDDSARREDVGVEGLLRAAGPGHQQVADGNEDAGGNHDAAAGEERAE